MSRVRITVTGRVQGVAFRWTLAMEAERNGVAGWVRNVGGDRVEADLEGPDDAVETVAEWMRHGPPGARVRGYDRESLSPAGQTRFDVLASE